VVLGGPVQARNYEKTFVCRQTNKRRRWRQRQDGAGVIFVAKSGDDPTIKI
jgi:hypothetical protein